MNANKSNKENAREIREYIKDDVQPTLDKHKPNPFLEKLLQNLKRWAKRCEDAIAEAKKDGYSPEFQRFWKVYDNKTGSKQEAYGVWMKLVDEPDVVIAAARLYKADCKARDQTVAHATTWLNGRRWESYEGVREQVREQKKCFWCDRPYYQMVSVKKEAGSGVRTSYRACELHWNYNNMTEVEVKKDLKQ